MCGDREQLGVDQRDELLEVSVDELAAFGFGLPGEMCSRVNVRAVEVVDAADRAVESGVGEERADIRLVIRMVVHLDGVEHPDVGFLADPLDRRPSALMTSSSP